MYGNQVPQNPSPLSLSLSLSLTNTHTHTLSLTDKHNSIFPESPIDIQQRGGQREERLLTEAVRVGIK